MSRTLLYFVIYYYFDYHSLFDMDWSVIHNNPVFTSCTVVQEPNFKYIVQYGGMFNTVEQAVLLNKIYFSKRGNGILLSYESKINRVIAQYFKSS